MRSVLVAVTAMLLLAGCGHDRDSGAAASRTAGVYEAVLSALVGSESPSTSSQGPPVVYAVPGGNEDIPASVQVQVVNTMRSSMELRFADERAEAIDAGSQGQAVRDAGLLVVVAPVPKTGTTIELPVELYRSTTDRRTVVVTLTEGSTGWSVERVAG